MLFFMLCTNKGVLITGEPEETAPVDSSLPTNPRPTPSLLENLTSNSTAAEEEPKILIGPWSVEFLPIAKETVQ